MMTTEWKIKFTLLVVFAEASHIVAGDGGFRLDHEYKYSLITKKFTLMSNDVWMGSVVRARLSIVPHSKNIFTGQLVETEIAQVNISGKWDTQLNDTDLLYWNLPASKPFKINLKNGVVQSLTVDRNITVEEVHQLKVVGSQLKVDTNGQNSQNVLYKKTEQTLSENCETIYDINPYAENFIEVNSDLKPKLKGTDEVINIVKTRNYSNCSEIVNGTGTVPMNPRLIQSESTHIVISGSLQRYTIQSSVTTNKAYSLDDPPSTTIQFVKLTLESMEKRDTWTPLSTSVLSSMMQALRRLSEIHLAAKSEDPEEQWSNCWSRFHSVESMCKFEFGPEWTSVESSNDCGFLKRKSICRRQYPGCEASACYSRLRNDICEKEFGSRLPTKMGEFRDCIPGFYRHRCCPNS